MCVRVCVCVHTNRFSVGIVARDTLLWLVQSHFDKHIPHRRRFVLTTLYFTSRFPPPNVEE